MSSQFLRRRGAHLAELLSSGEGEEEGGVERILGGVAVVNMQRGGRIFGST